MTWADLLCSILTKTAAVRLRGQSVAELIHWFKLKIAIAKIGLFPDVSKNKKKSIVDYGAPRSSSFLNCLLLLT